MMSEASTLQTSTSERVTSGNYDTATTYINVDGERVQVKIHDIIVYIGNLVLMRQANGDEPCKPSELYGLAIRRMIGDLRR